MKSKGKKREKGISLNEIYRYIPVNHSLVIRDIEAQVRTVLAVLPMTVSERTPVEVEFEARLLPQPEGEVIPLNTVIVDFKKMKNNNHILILRIEWPDLTPGSYEIEIEVREKASGDSFSVRKLVVIL